MNGAGSEAGATTTVVYSMAPSSALNLAAVPASSLVVGPAGITLDLAARAVVRDGKVAWEGGSSAPILSAAESAARKKARAEAMARARDRLKRLLPLRDGAPLAPVLIVDLRARPALLSALAEIYEAVDLPAPSVLRVPTSAMGGVPFWFSDATPRPETFPEEVATIRRGRESVKIILAGAALEAALARAAERQSDTQPPEGIQVKLKGKRARRRFTLTVGDASDGLDATALTMALRWLDDAYGPIPAYRLDARGVPPEQWQPILYALLDGETEAARMAWVKPELTSDEPGAPWSVRPVALQLRIRARGEKPKAVAPPKPKPVPMGFCEKKDIAKVMRGRMGAFRFCYERRLQYNPNLQGKLGLRFTISESGKVESVRVVKKTIADKEVEACVIKNIKKLHFAKPQGGKCVVQWPFVFHRN